MESQNDTGVALSQLLFEPTPLAHIWATVMLLCATHIVSMRVDEVLGACIFAGSAIAYTLLALPPIQYTMGWDRSSKVSLSMVYLSIMSLATLIYFLQGKAPDNLPEVSIFISLIFPLLALCRGYLLLNGLMGKAVQSTPGAIVGFFSSRARLFFSARVAFLSVLIWWFGFGATNPVNLQPLRVFFWTLMFSLILFSGHFLYRKISNIGGPSSAKTKSFASVSILLLDWSMVSAMRMMDEGKVASTMFEELAMFIFVIAVIMWSRTSGKPDPKISSRTLALGFAYVILYAGSISQLSIGTDLNISAVLGVGHALTSFVIFLLVLPMAKKVEASVTQKLLETTDHSNNSESADQPI